MSTAAGAGAAARKARDCTGDSAEDGGFAGEGDFAGGDDGSAEPAIVAIEGASVRTWDAGILVVVIAGGTENRSIGFEVLQKVGV